MEKNYHRVLRHFAGAPLVCPHCERTGKHRRELMEITIFQCCETVVIDEGEGGEGQIVFLPLNGTPPEANFQDSSGKLDGKLKTKRMTLEMKIQ